MKTFFSILLILVFALISQGQFEPTENVIRACAFPITEFIQTTQTPKRRSKKKTRRFIIIPNQKQTPTPPNVFRIVKALAGDTVAKIAARYGVNGVDLANVNGFPSLRTPLAAGREVRIPLKYPENAALTQPQQQFILPQEKGLGVKPKQSRDGKVQAVMDYFNENPDDPSTMRFVRWSPVTARVYGGNSYWSVQVKFRAKNRLGAYVLTEMVFYIRNNKVVWTQRL